MTKQFNNTSGADNAKKKIEKMLETVSNMTDTDFINWIKGLSKFHNYSFMNRILIMLSGGSAVMGAKQWSEKYNRKVKPDQYRWPIWILAPKIYKYKTTETDETGKEKEVIKQGICGFKCVKVYDIEQTAGPDLPDVYTKEVKGITKDQTLKIADKLGFKVDYEKMQYERGGYIKHETGEIFLNSIHSDNEHIGTLLHEIAHGLLEHHVKSKRENLTRDVIECEAETLTHIIGTDFGIERASKFYLKSWGLDGQIMKSFDKINRGYSKFQKVYKEVV
jgi:hypothetical protein